MASSTTPNATEPTAAAELTALLAFPQFDRLKALPSDRARELYARGMNNPRAFWLLNRRYVRGLSQYPPPELSGAGQRVAADLAANGIAHRISGGMTHHRERTQHSQPLCRHEQSLLPQQRCVLRHQRSLALSLDPVKNSTHRGATPQIAVRTPLRSGPQRSANGPEWIVGGSARTSPSAGVHRRRVRPCAAGTEADVWLARTTTGATTTTTTGAAAPQPSPRHPPSPSSIMNHRRRVPQRLRHARRLAGMATRSTFSSCCTNPSPPAASC